VIIVIVVTAVIIILQYVFAVYTVGYKKVLFYFGLLLWWICTVVKAKLSSLKTTASVEGFVDGQHCLKTHPSTRSKNPVWDLTVKT